MGKFVKTAAALGVVAVVGSQLSAEAAVVDEYEEETVYHDSAYACAWEYDDDANSDTYIDTCGALEDTDGDGERDRAHVGVYRQDCKDRGSFRRCTIDTAWEEVDLADVTIDTDAGTAAISTRIDTCTIDMEFVGSGHAVGFSNGYEGPSPRVRLRDLTIRVERDSAYGFDYQAADAAGSVCQWHDGTWDGGEIGRYYDREIDRGYRLHPEEAPIVGDAIVRGEREAGARADEYACSYWDDGSGWVIACASNSDADGDGTTDEHVLEAEQSTCDGHTCQSDYRSTDEVDALTLDMASGVAYIDGSIDDCTVDVTIEGEYRYDGSYEYGYDSPGLGSEPGEIRLGSTRRGSYEEMWGAPASGATVCDWPEVDNATRTGAYFGHSHSSRTDHYIGVDPSGLGA